MTVFLCPCCEKPAERRSAPITEAECSRGYSMMLLAGWTAERLLKERAADLDAIAPGLTDWLRKQPMDDPAGAVLRLAVERANARLLYPDRKVADA